MLMSELLSVDKLGNHAWGEVWLVKFAHNASGDIRYQCFPYSIYNASLLRLIFYATKILSTNEI